MIIYYNILGLPLNRRTDFISKPKAVWCSGYHVSFTFDHLIEIEDEDEWLKIGKGHLFDPGIGHICFWFYSLCGKREYSVFSRLQRGIGGKRKAGSSQREAKIVCRYHMVSMHFDFFTQRLFDTPSFQQKRTQTTQRSGCK